MTRRRILIIVAVVVLAGGGTAIGLEASGASGSSKSGSVVILDTVQERTLQSSIQLTGTLARKQLRNVTAASGGLVTELKAKDGDTTRAGEAMFALNGREAIAEEGTVPFFRSLTVGDTGPDVTQLKQILAASGYDPGPMTDEFTEETQFALAQWQAAHGYPDAAPVTSQSVTVSLEQGTGYELGTDDSAGLVIGPPAETAAAIDGRRGAATLDTFTTEHSSSAASSPVVTIQSLDAQVSQGEPATFVVTASAASPSATVVNLAESGTATSQDIVEPPLTVTIAPGATQASVTVETRSNGLVEPSKTVVMTVGSGNGYTVGSPASATTTITNDNVPTLTLSGGRTVSPGSAVRLTVSASAAPLSNTQVELSFAGDAVPGTDYTPVDPIVVLPAGHRSVSVTVDTLPRDVIEPDRYIVVGLVPSPSSYAVSQSATTVVTIRGTTTLPTATLTSSTRYLEKGEPYQVTVSLSEAESSAVVLHLDYGGTAVEGTDYTLPGGVLEVPAGMTSTEVVIPTVTDDVVEADRTLTVSLAPSSDYTIGSPSRCTVQITSSVLPKLSLTASTSSVAEGGAASFTIISNQPVVKNTSVSFAAQGTALPGQSYEPLVGTALLRTGQSRVTVVLRTLRTDVSFEPTDMIVGTWPAKVGAVDVQVGSPVAAGETILSLTHPSLTVTLQASAANRSMLKVGQPATVQIAGATTSFKGTIVELDSTPTELPASSPTGGGSQVYEGRIDASGLTGADGSQVSITVVDQQVRHALTVPIAAVLQDGTGHDIVRVYDRKTGTTTDVPVTTGLSDGSYIQVTHGVFLGETVIVQVDQSS